MDSKGKFMAKKKLEVPGIKCIDKTQPLNLAEPASWISHIEILYDCKVRIEDEFLADKLANSFKKFRKRTENECKLKASVK